MAQAAKDKIIAVIDIVLFSLSGLTQFVKQSCRPFDALLMACLYSDKYKYA